MVYKPDFVGHSRAIRGNHSSRASVAKRLVQPTRITSLENGRSCDHVIPIWFCSRWGLPCQRHCWPCGALLPHPFTLTTPKRGGLLSVALSLGSPPPSVTRHRHSVESGLSSPACAAAAARPTGRCGICGGA